MTLIGDWWSRLIVCVCSCSSWRRCRRRSCCCRSYRRCRSHHRDSTGSAHNRSQRIKFEPGLAPLKGIVGKAGGQRLLLFKSVLDFSWILHVLLCQREGVWPPGTRPLAPGCVFSCFECERGRSHAPGREASMNTQTEKLCCCATSVGAEVFHTLIEHLDPSSST